MKELPSGRMRTQGRNEESRGKRQMIRERNVGCMGGVVQNNGIRTSYAETRLDAARGGL